VLGRLYVLLVFDFGNRTSLWMKALEQILYHEVARSRLMFTCPAGELCMDRLVRCRFFCYSNNKPDILLFFEKNTKQNNITGL
jgi:hypothetical protein